MHVIVIESKLSYLQNHPCNRDFHFEFSMRSIAFLAIFLPIVFNHNGLCRVIVKTGLEAPKTLRFCCCVTDESKNVTHEFHLETPNNVDSKKNRDSNESIYYIYI